MKEFIVDFILFYYSISTPTLLVFWGVVGLCIGSFINVLAYRLPIMLEKEWKADAKLFLESDAQDYAPLTKDDLIKEQARIDEIRAEEKAEFINLNRPRSHCPACDIQLKWWMNIPLLSWLLLRGKCGFCNHKISLEYPFVEFATALLTVGVIWFLPEYHAVTYWLLVLVWGLFALARVDAKSGLLPDEMTMSLLWLGLLVNASFNIVPLREAVLGAAIGYMFMRLLATFFQVSRGYTVLGGGDMKMCAAIGAWLGWQALPLILFVAPLIALLSGLPRKKPSHETYRFGPGLAYSTYLILLLVILRPKELEALLPIFSF